MGTWGTGIFDDDSAADIRDAFEDKLMAGADVAEATQFVIAKFVLDHDEAKDPVAYLALAALQVEHGALQPDIRRKALNIIVAGQDLQRWLDGGRHTTNYTERKRVLDALREKLIS
jgi:hypothetical protein